MVARERKATRTEVAREVQVRVMVVRVVRAKVIAASIGSVRCWTSARRAKRMSLEWV